jgi:hypothetical protein
MGESNSASGVSIFRLILVPAVISFAVTILRLIGELQNWSTTLFNPSAGGGGAVVGIVWLVPIFGIYFALKLSSAGQGPTSIGKAIGYTVLGLVVVGIGGFVGFGPAQFPGKEALGYVILAVAPIWLFPAWPSLFKTLVAYGYAARIPVAIVMFFAISGNWGTHYDALPPEFPADMAFWPKYLHIGLLPQMIFWVAFTVLIGALFGTIVTAFVRRSGQPAENAS